ncbi:hypothetical protein ACF1HU_07620 [Streptomyces olivaceus]
MSNVGAAVERREVRGHDDGPASEYDDHEAESAPPFSPAPDPAEYDR